MESDLGKTEAVSRHVYALTMAGPDPFALLRALVKAHDVPRPGTGAREPIYYFSAYHELQHHALPDPPPEVDDALVNELHLKGLLDIDYMRSGEDMLLVPTPEGRELIEAHDRISVEERAPRGTLGGAVFAGVLVRRSLASASRKRLYPSTARVPPRRGRQPLRPRRHACRPVPPLY